MLDSLSGVVFGLFLLSVAIKGNTRDMINLAKKDKGFLQWIVAAAILAYLHGIPSLRGPVRWLIVMSFIGLALNKTDTIKENIGIFWNQLGGN